MKSSGIRVTSEKKNGDNSVPLLSAIDSSTDKSTLQPMDRFRRYEEVMD